MLKIIPPTTRKPKYNEYDVNQQEKLLTYVELNINEDSIKYFEIELYSGFSFVSLFICIDTITLMS